MPEKNQNYKHLQGMLGKIPLGELSAPWDEVNCLEWNRGRHRQGYGILRRNGVFILAHRASYEEVNGPIPYAVMVLHHCDNPPCFHPTHLFSGTQLDNMRDASAKGHMGMADQRGSSNPSSKLKDEDVASIRKLRVEGNKQIDIARLFGVSKS